MRKILSVIFLFVSVAAFSQPLRDINFEYLYNPQSSVLLQLRPVTGESSFTILYSLDVKDTANLETHYSVHWEGRDQLSDKEGMPMVLSDIRTVRTASGLAGSGTLPLEGAPRYLVAKVIHGPSRTAWLYYTPLKRNYPVNNYLISNTTPVIESYVGKMIPLQLAFDSVSWIVSYYDHEFPAAAPAFSEAQARVPALMRVDSVFSVEPDDEIKFTGNGLYLVQRDTAAVAGLAFRVEGDYPQYSRLTNLAGPLVYITTRQEYDRIEAAKGNKRAFDRVILGITQDTDRARTLMRSYFRRVELANRYFTSYKEGWKTDRGMIYIIFGVPEQVLRFEDREVWSYDNDRFKLRFNFARSSSLFDPDNYVLIREKKYESAWYEVIDLWRNARF